jgi:hypothetical protein
VKDVRAFWTGTNGSSVRQKKFGCARKIYRDYFRSKTPLRSNQLAVNSRTQLERSGAGQRRSKVHGELTGNEVTEFAGS